MEIAGYKGSGGWAKEQHTWFHAKFNKPFHITIYGNGEPLESKETASSNHLVAVLTFDNSNENEILAKVGISHVDYDGALKNLEAEIADWNFDKVRQSAYQLWSDELNQIQTKGGTEDEKAIFYTSLYHTSISPYTFSDVDGRYRGMDQEIHISNGKTIYTVFSLWDTFRGQHPLKTITDPECDNDFINTLVCK
jgi:putative alpha-1,2-mannosidase